MKQSNNNEQVNKLLKIVLPMDTQSAFQYLAETDAEAQVVNRVAALLKPSETRTNFLNERDAADWLFASVTADEDLSGRTFAHIELIKKLGQGGMGAVYEARDLILERRVAVKALLLKQPIKSAAAERFRREALLLSKLNHENICRIYSLIEAEATDFLVLEYIEGEVLGSEQFKSFPKSKQFNIIRQILKGLQAAHRKNIIHRDIKPENIMINNKGVVKLLDFGISRLNEHVTANNDNQSQIESDEQTIAGTIVGTLNYMSPEQAAGDTVTTATDMYSFGILLQTLLSNVPPYPLNTTAEQVLQLSHKGETLNPKDIPKHWQKLIQSLKSFAPADRPTANDVLLKVAAIQAKPIKRLRIIGASIFILLAALATGKYISDLKYERNQAQQAQQKAEQVVKFLSGMFQQANPYVTSEKEVTVVDVLNQAAKRIDEELVNQHDARVYLKAVISDSLMQLGKTHQSSDLISQAFTSLNDDKGVSEKTQRFVTEIKASFLINTGKFNEAIPLIDKLIVNDPGDDQVMTSRLKFKKVVLLQLLNNFEEAIELALSSYQEIANLGSELTEFKVNFINQVAICFFYLGQYEHAKNYFLEGIEIAETADSPLFGVDVELLDGLSGSYMMLGNHEKTIEIGLLTIQKIQKLLPTGHIDLGRYYNNMAQKYYRFKDYEHALDWNNDALNIYQDNFKKRNMDENQVIPIYASTLISRGNILSESPGNSEEALSIYFKAKELLARMFDDNSLEIARVEFEIALLYWEMNKTDQAEQFLANAEKSFELNKRPLVGKHLSAHELKIVMLKQQSMEAARKHLLDIKSQLREEGASKGVFDYLDSKFSELSSTQ